jgi:hypothetical protein
LIDFGFPNQPQGTRRLVGLAFGCVLLSATTFPEIHMSMREYSYTGRSVWLFSSVAPPDFTLKGPSLNAVNKDDCQFERVSSCFWGQEIWYVA